MSQHNVAVQRKLDEICNRFEDEWIPSDRVDIVRLQEFCGQMNAEYRQPLLRDLIKVDVELRFNSGLDVDASDYSQLDTFGAIQFAESSIRKFGRDKSTNRSDATETTGAYSFDVSQRLGPYELLEKIGEGGMGVVWKAWQEHPVKRFLAIKVIGSKTITTDTLARFDAERQALAMMDHPGIARLIDAGSTDLGQPFFAMELVNGESITKYCDRHQLTIEHRLRLFVDVCHAVGHAHQKGIIHRDLKPSNLLVSPSDEGNPLEPIAKVIDFGLVKALSEELKLHEESQHTRFDQVLGTYRYMSPEQARIGNRTEDVRSDIFSLGVILFELLAGSTPIESSVIEDQSVISILGQIREKESVRPSSRIRNAANAHSKIAVNRSTTLSELLRGLIGELDWIVLKATDCEPERRYPSVFEFADDIKRFLNREAIVARPPSRTYQIKKFVSRNRWSVTFGTTAVLLLIGGIVGTTVGMLNANANAAAAQAANQQAQRRLEQLDENNRILAGIFSELNVYKPDSKRPLQLVLGERLSEAAELLAVDLTLLTPSQLRTQLKIAGALVGLGQTRKAITILENSLQLSRHKFGDSARITTQISTDLAGAYLSNRQNELAKSQFEWSISQIEKTADVPIRALNGLAAVYRHLDQPQKTVEIQLIILKHLRKQERPNDTLYVFALTQLANAQFQIGETELAETHFRMALDHGRGWLKEDDLNLLHVKHALVRLLIRTEQLPEAIELGREVLEGRIAKLGEDNMESMVAREDLVIAYLANGQLEKAAPHIVRAFANSLSLTKPGRPYPFFRKEYFDAIKSLGIDSEQSGPIKNLKEALQIGYPSELELVQFGDDLFKFLSERQ